MVADELEPGGLLGVEGVAGVGAEDPVAVVAAHGVGEGRELLVEAAGAAEEGDEGRQFREGPGVGGDGVEAGVGIPHAEGREARSVLLERGEHVLDLGEGDQRAALRLGVVDREGVEPVAVLAAEGRKILGEGGGAGLGIGIPLGADEFVLRVVVDGLQVGGAGLDDGGDDGAGERGAGGGDELLLGLFAVGVAGIGAGRLAGEREGLLLDGLAVMAWKRAFTTWPTVVPPIFWARVCCCSGVSWRSMRARRPAREETVSASVAPMTTSMARSLNGTVGRVMGGRLAVLRDLVTPMASTMT